MISPARSVAARLAALLVGTAGTAYAFLGVGDVSFVTVIANPAEAINWAAELENLNSQLQAARGTLQTASDLKAYAGDPRAAVAGVRDLAEITAGIGNLTSGSQTDADLLRAWQALDSAQRQQSASAFLQQSGAGTSMDVFGQEQARNPALYAGWARQTDAVQQVRAQIAQEQTARAAVGSELSLAWMQFRAATTESGKQAVLAQISQLQAQNQVLDTRRRAMLDDLELAERQGRTMAAARAQAADEGRLAESAQLNSAAASRAQAAEAQRQATLQKTRAASTAPDYSNLKLWTTADTGGTSE